VTQKHIGRRYEAQQYFIFFALVFILLATAVFAASQLTFSRFAPIDTSQFTYGAGSPKSTVVKSDGTIYILNVTYNEIEKRDSAGNWTTIAGPDATVGMLTNVIAVADDGSIYFADSA
jgi:hypothetical protein